MSEMSLLKTRDGVVVYGDGVLEFRGRRAGGPTARTSDVDERRSACASASARAHAAELANLTVEQRQRRAEALCALVQYFSDATVG